MLVRESAYRMMLKAGLQVVGCPSLVRRPRKNVEPLLELHVLPAARLFRECVTKEYVWCKGCERYIGKHNEPIIIDGASISTSADLFSVGEEPSVFLATEKFKDSVALLGLSGIRFEEVQMA